MDLGRLSEHPFTITHGGFLVSTHGLAISSRNHQQRSSICTFGFGATSQRRWFHSPHESVTAAFWFPLERLSDSRFKTAVMITRLALTLIIYWKDIVFV